MVALAGLNEMRQGLAHRFELCNFVVDLSQMFFGHCLYLSTLAGLIFLQAQQGTTVFD